MKRDLMILVILLAFLTATPALADITGCVDSPENPTAILAVAGSAGALVVALRSRMRRK